MATERKSLPRHAEAARIDAIAVLRDAEDCARAVTQAIRTNDKVAALGELGELRALLGQARLILHQQGDKSYYGEEPC